MTSLGALLSRPFMINESFWVHFAAENSLYEDRKCITDMYKGWGLLGWRGHHATQPRYNAANVSARVTEIGV